MTDHRAPISRWAVRGLYFFAFVLVFWPAADLLTNTWPIQLGSLQWRYGFMGLLAGFLNTPILSLALTLVLAHSLNHRRTLRTLSVLGLLAAAGLLAVLFFFALDVVQLRATVPEERMASFKAGALIAELKHLTSFVALALLGVGGWRTSASRDEAAAKRAEPSTIVMKSSSQG